MKSGLTIEEFRGQVEDLTKLARDVVAELSTEEALGVALQNLSEQVMDDDFIAQYGTDFPAVIVALDSAVNGDGDVRGDRWADMHGGEGADKRIDLICIGVSAILNLFEQESIRHGHG